MKKIIRILAIAFLASNAFYFTSCTEDGGSGGGTVTTNPSVTLTGVPFADQNPGGEITINLSVSKGTANLSAVEVKEDGVKLATANILSIEGIGTPNNPFIIDANGFSGDVTLRLPDTEGSYSYSFTATDQDGKSGSDDFTIVVATPRPTVTVFGVPTNELTAGTDFTVTLDATVGGAQLRTLTVKENDVDLPVSRLVILGLASFGNPYTIGGTDKDGLSYDVTITTPSAPGSYTYLFNIDDEDSEFDEDSFTVSVVGTAITETLTAKLLENQSNINPVGAMDLSTGKQTGVSSVGEVPIEDAEIRDMGLDCTIPAPGFNWRRQIGTVNGADLRGVDLTQVENFSFDNVGTVEQIIGAYDTGISYVDGEAVNCGSGSTTAATDVSDILEIGDLLVVLGSTGTYYLIRVDDVVETGADNEDYYLLSIKY